jgi:hypothetical protein
MTAEGMTDPRTPRTEAGRELWTAPCCGQRCNLDDAGEPIVRRTITHAAILAIEAEASTLGSSERLAAALRDGRVHSAGRDHEAVWWCDGCVPVAVKEALSAAPDHPALSDPDAERQRAIGLLRFTTHIRSCGWNSHKPCDCGLNQALGLTPTQDWRDDEALAADPALSDPDAERQRAIEQERARLRREYDDRMEMIGAASPPADVSPWDILRWVRDELLVDDPSAALPAAQEPER